MKRLVAVLVFGLVIAASPAFAQDGVKIDFGGGLVLQDVDSQSGGTGGDPKGLFATLGWVLPKGFVARLSLSKTSDESSVFADLGLGVESFVEKNDLMRFDATAGYMFNRLGLVRPILHGGVARIVVKDKVKRSLTGESAEAIDDDDTVITLGAGVEVGQDHHHLLLDFGFDSGVEVQNTLDTNLEFDLSSFHIGYVYRF